MVDFNLKEDSPVVNDVISSIFQQIDLLFDTRPTEVFGQEDFGTNYERYLYNLKLSNYDLEEMITVDLNRLELFGFNPQVKVYLLQGTEKDIALIDINLIRDGETYNQVYKID